MHDLGREKENHAIYYYILLGNEEGGFYIDKTSGDIFTNKSLDREKESMYALYILASKKSDLHISESELMFLSTESLERNSTVAKVWITVLDENDNAPQFSQDVSRKLCQLCLNIHALSPLITFRYITLESVKSLE